MRERRVQLAKDGERVERVGESSSERLCVAHEAGVEFDGRARRGDVHRAEKSGDLRGERPLRHDDRAARRRLCALFCAAEVSRNETSDDRAFGRRRLG